MCYDVIILASRLLEIPRVAVTGPSGGRMDGEANLRDTKRE